MLHHNIAENTVRCTSLAPVVRERQKELRNDRLAHHCPAIRRKLGSSRSTQSTLGASVRVATVEKEVEDFTWKGTDEFSQLEDRCFRPSSQVFAPSIEGVLDAGCLQNNLQAATCIS